MRTIMMSQSSLILPVLGRVESTNYPLSPVLIPALEPEIFNGNPANYHSFIDTFDALISFNVPEPKRKLYLLLQCTTGPAHALVKGCPYMPGDQGYYRAREMLKSTFGQKFQIAKACTCCAHVLIEWFGNTPGANKGDWLQRNALGTRISNSAS